MTTNIHYPGIHQTKQNELGHYIHTGACVPSSKVHRSRLLI